MSISVIFSVMIYNIVSRQIEGFINMQNQRIAQFEQSPQLDLPPHGTLPEPPYIDTQQLRNQEQQLLITLVVINLVILGVAGGAGYVLAGRTLHPIQIMVNEQNQFISNASHELRTPIAVLRAEMEANLMEKHISDTQARSLITSNLEELTMLQNLSNRLLRLTQLHTTDAGQIVQHVVVSDILRDAKQKVMSLAKQKNISIQYEENKYSVYGDQHSLIELFVILLDNAIKYSPKHTTITIGSTSEHDAVIVTISDQGVGISEKDLPHIFERFYRADTTRSRIDGYGLGLSIAKKIVEIHNGTIRVTSNLNQGASFIVQLPTKPS
jgi:signal transduction histidine kinase